MQLRQTILAAVATIALAAPATNHAVRPAKNGFVVITDYIKNDGKKDVSDAIQKVIDSNPNRTIYFPDGVYMISKPILTPADPTKSVALLLSNFAVVRATPDWAHTEAMIRLGGKDPFNTIRVAGSNYYLEGGVIDGNKVANGVSIDSGRETEIRNSSIKNTIVGLHIKHGANSGSSDSDIHNVDIVGTSKPESVGVLVEGCDNTFTNMRIGGVHVGMIIKSGGNCMRNIHPLFYGAYDNYETSCGFVDESNNNIYDFCYSDEFCTGFRTKTGKNLYNSCFVYWYSNKGAKHVVFHSEGAFNSSVMNMIAGIGKHNATKENIILETGKPGGNGVFFNLMVNDPKYITDTSHERYMTR